MILQRFFRIPIIAFGATIGGFIPLLIVSANETKLEPLITLLLGEGWYHSELMVFCSTGPIFLISILLGIAGGIRITEFSLKRISKNHLSQKISKSEILIITFGIVVGGMLGRIYLSDDWRFFNRGLLIGAFLGAVLILLIIESIAISRNDHM